MSLVWVRPQQKPDPDAIPFYFGGRAAQDESGRVLAERYELIEVLASGGTAVVYNAVDTSTGGSVAVKVLYEAAREAVGAFFGQEGRLAARIQSPHLVHARHFGEDDGCLFIVFELVPGHALPDLYFMQLMPWRELFGIVLQVLAGLDALHQVGIVHRDVKPDNIIVNRTLGNEVHVTLLDLGFAWVPPERKLTGAPEPTRQVFGTDGFIAPELLGGGLPEPRNDLYSVGAMMYLMLTAQRVPDLSPAPELMNLPSPRAFVPGLPQSVDDIVMRALSDVESRFQDAEEMAAAIRAALTENSATSSTALRVSRATPSSMSSTPPRDWHEVSEAAASTSTSSAPVAAGSASGALDTAPCVEAVVAAAPPAHVSVTSARAALEAEQTIEHDPAPAEAATEETVRLSGASMSTTPIVAAPPRMVLEPSVTPPASAAHDDAADPPQRRVEAKRVVGVAATAASTRWAVAAAMLLSALVGGGVVWLASHPGPQEPLAMEMDAAALDVQREPPTRGDYPRTPPHEEQDAVQPGADGKTEQPPADPRKGSRAPSAPRRGAGLATASRSAAGKTPSTLLVSSAGTTRSLQSNTAPQERGDSSFAQAMARLTSDVRACAATAYTGAARPASIGVRVRFDPVSRSIDQVRVAKVGTNDPLAVCVERVVRAAAPPASDDPNETFTYSLEK